MEHIYILMGSYKDEPDYDTILGAYKSINTAREACERITWDSSIYAAYIVKTELHQ